MVQSQKEPIEITDDVLPCVVLPSVAKLLTGMFYRLEGPVFLMSNRHFEIE